MVGCDSIAYKSESDKVRVTVAVKPYLLAYTFSLLTGIHGTPTGIRKLDQTCDEMPIIRVENCFLRLSCITGSSRIGNQSTERALALFLGEKKVPKRQPRGCGVSGTCRWLLSISELHIAGSGQ